MRCVAFHAAPYYQARVTSSSKKRAAHLTRARMGGVLGILAALLLVALGAGAAIGNVPIDLGRALDGSLADNPERLILFEARVPRVLMAAIVGAALAIAGAALQGLMRNPLAEPHIIGVSGGAALGAVLAVVLVGGAAFAEVYVLPIAASGGALLSMLVIYRMAMINGRLQPYVLLLAGVVYNAFAGALIMFVNSITDHYQAYGILFWLMGSLSTQGYGLVGVAAAYVAIGAIVLLRQARSLNLLSLGEESALQLGVDVPRVRRVAFFASALLVGAVVSVSGMIGFVGLIVPHILRLLFGADHRLLLPASLLGGAMFLVAADTVARTAFGAVEIPVGVITAMCGGPFFLYLLQRDGGRRLG